MRKIVILIISFIVFVGCSPKVEYQTIYKTRTVYLKPSNDLLVDNITVPIPPNKKSFINANPIKREQMLTFYIIDLLKTIKKYKVKNKNILEWYKETNLADSKGN